MRACFLQLIAVGGSVVVVKPKWLSEDAMWAEAHKQPHDGAGHGNDCALDAPATGMMLCGGLQ